MPDYFFPVAGGSITSGYGPRSSPGGIGSTWHRGVDIGGARGSGVGATTGGQVVFAGWAGGYGNQVRVRDAQGYTHSYSHLDSVSVQRGQSVSGGSILGALGSTGKSTGPHLHYAVKNALDKYVNPKGILSQGKALLAQGKGLLSGDAGGIISMGANAILPGSGMVLDGLGITGDCGWICQLQTWVKESGFFQRLALAFLAFIILLAAFYLMKSNDVTGALKKGFANG